jgi:hypothetical protein
MPITEGVVSAVSRKERNTPYGAKTATSFEVDGEWYSGGFKQWEVDKGDEVRVTWEENKDGYKQVKGIAVTAKGVPTVAAAQTGVPRAGRSFPIAALAPERTINRQNALTAAVALTVGFKETLAPGTDTREEVINTARLFEAYTTGDLDAEEAKAMLGGE